MDWSRAKNLLIILFLALNVFLAAYLFMSFQNNSSSENIANTQKILKSRGYEVKAKIPDISQVYNLKYENEKYDKTFIAEKLLGINLKVINQNQEVKNNSKTLKFTSENSFTYIDKTPSKSIDISTQERAQKYAVGLIKELKLPISSPYFDFYKTNPDKSITIKYIEKFKGKYIFDNLIEFNLSENGLKYLECNLVKINGFDKEKVNIIPAYQILLNNFIDGDNKVIEEIDLGYEFGIDIGIYGLKTPGWRIKLEDNTSIFFDNQGQKR
jgi:regulatory protein YycI of two-component signal transduction system YycFG